jgi:TfoX/Sxy family transcriptional regulator of competence genes
MKWKKAPEELVRFLEENLRGVDCQFKKMFGYPVYFINNNMFIGAHEDNLFLRLPASERERVLSTHDETAPFEPLPGRIMKEYITIPDSVYGDPEIFSGLLDESVAYVSSLPPKVKKKRKK